MSEVDALCDSWMGSNDKVESYTVVTYYSTLLFCIQFISDIFLSDLHCVRCCYFI